MLVVIIILSSAIYGVRAMRDIPVAPVEAVWWNDMHIIATPLTRRDRVYAVKVVLTNRSAKDTMLFRDPEPWEPKLYLQIRDLADTHKHVTRDRKILPVDSDISPSDIITELAPGNSRIFCITLDKHLDPSFDIERQKKYYFALSTRVEMAWKRANGYTTPFGRERKAETGKFEVISNPYLVLGLHKITRLKDRGCDPK